MEAAWVNWYLYSLFSVVCHQIKMANLIFTWQFFKAQSCEWLFRKHRQKRIFEANTGEPNCGRPTRTFWFFTRTVSLRQVHRDFTEPCRFLGKRPFCLQWLNTYPSGQGFEETAWNRTQVPHIANLWFFIKSKDRGAKQHMKDKTVLGGTRLLHRPLLHQYMRGHLWHRQAELERAKTLTMLNSNVNVQKKELELN